MSRSALIGNIVAMPQDAGFVVGDRIAIRPKSFNPATQGGGDLLLLKILGNIDTSDGITGPETRCLGSYLDATPLVVGLRTRDEGSKSDVVCFRHGMPVLDPDTATDLFVKEVPLLIYAAPGELYVNFNGNMPAGERQERGWSLKQLTTGLGVSWRTVPRYENGMNASIEVATHLEKLFDRPFPNPVDVLTGAKDARDAEPILDDPGVDPGDKHVLSVLTRVGFAVRPTTHVPLRIISEDAGRKKETNVLTGHSPSTQGAKERVQIMSSLGEITQTRSVYFVEEQQRRESIDGTGIVSCEELAAINDPDEIHDLTRERIRGPAEN